MTTVKWLLVAVAAGYAVVLAAMYVFQRSLMYFPDPLRTAPVLAGLPEAGEVSLTSADGERLVAWHVPPRSGKPLIVYFQGNAGGLSLRVERFRKLIEDGNGLL